MGSQNQEMVNTVHLNHGGFKGGGITYFFKPEIPQGQHRTISAVSTRVQSEDSPIVSSKPALPSVKETVCTEPNVSQFQVLKSVFNFYDNLSANLSIQNGLKRCCQALNIPYPLPGQVFATDPYKNIFPNLGGSNVH